MMPNTYDRDRLVQAHRQDLLREAEHERLLAQLPQPKRDTLRLPTQFKMFWRESARRGEKLQTKRGRELLPGRAFASSGFLHATQKPAR